MKKIILYVPATYFLVDEDQGGICDAVLQGFFKEEDAKNLYPDTEIIKLELPFEG